MINSLTRLGLSSTCTLEVRQTAIGVADAVLGWELLRKQRKHVRAAKAKAQETVSRQGLDPAVTTASVKRERDEDFAESDSSDQPRKLIKAESSADTSEGLNASLPTEGAEASAAASAVSSSSAAAPATNAPPAATSGTVFAPSQNTEREDEFGLNAPMVHILTNFIVRLGLQAADSTDSSVRRLLSRCVTLFQRLCSLHPVVRTVKLLPHLERLLQQTGVVAAVDRSGRADDKGKDTLATLSNRAIAALTSFLLSAFSCDTDPQDSGLAAPNSVLFSNLGMVRELLQPMLSSSSPRVQRLSRALICKVVLIPDVNNP